MNLDTTPTPRTDEQIWTTEFHHKFCDVVDMNFARQLERELAETTSEVARLREENADLKQWLDERYKALSEADDENENLRNLLGDLVKITNFYWDNSSNLKPKDWQPFQNILNELTRLAPALEEPVIQDS